MRTHSEREIHCHTCGGFIGDARAVTYEAPRERGEVAEPRSGLCACGAPVVYGPPPGSSSTPGIPAAVRPE